MKVKVNDTFFGVNEVDLSLLKYIHLKVFGYVSYVRRKKEGCRRKILLYIVNCKEH